MFLIVLVVNPILLGGGKKLDMQIIQIQNLNYREIFFFLSNYPLVLK